MKRITDIKMIKRLKVHASLILIIGLLTACSDEPIVNVSVEEGEVTSSLNLTALEEGFQKITESELITESTQVAMEKLEELRSGGYEIALDAIKATGLQLEGLTLDEVVQTIGDTTKGIADVAKFDYLYGYIVNDLTLTEGEVLEYGYLLLEDVAQATYEDAKVADLLTLSSWALIVLNNSEDEAIKQVALAAYELYYALGTGEYLLHSDEALAQIQELNKVFEIYKSSLE